MLKDTCCLDRKATGFEVIKLEYSFKLKVMRNDWLLVDTCPQAANHCALFEFENELKFYNLEARCPMNPFLGPQMVVLLIH